MVDPDERSSTSIVVACAQTDPILGDIEANTDMTVEAIRGAVALGADVIVLPECASGGWAFADRAESAAAAQPLTGSTIRAWEQLAKEHNVWVSGGFGEKADGGALYNSAVLVGPNGVESLYRKVHLWNSENLAFDPGNLGYPVTETPFGRVGMLICYDAWVPESFRSLAVEGADLVLAPSDWVPNPHQPADMPPLAHLMVTAGAHSNQMYVAAASRYGIERGQQFIGSSMIADHTGWPLARAGGGKEIIVAQIDPIGSRSARRNDPFNRPLWDRRVSQYEMGEVRAR
ncbi:MULTISPECIES: nitrilase-related carbon-nitrogen hydrolase [Leucobacter]|uniref:nitrilase-related carbon-nitrogen hydrolase n=1 Tax=Leucobacter TaxID=55968 RepID=UPI002103E0BB|nr:nitrilase-related carbon-nitrogen hydrolase [Leucobacter aridicollis]UTX53515.1 carbon-nitrogen hydrolase [Leucobacter aridicollis]